MMITHDGMVALTGLWAAVAIAAFPFTLRWGRPISGAEAPHQTLWEFGGLAACTCWPLLPIGFVVLLICYPIIWVIEETPRKIADWWSSPWSARR